MSQSSVDLVDVLGQIRARALVTVESWPDLADLLDAILPTPLSPFALLPVATGRAAGEPIENLIDIASAVLLADLSLRIIDDCADLDDPNALYRSLGVGRATNYALALSTVAARRCSQLAFASAHQSSLAEDYVQAFLCVCQGQDRDMALDIETLADYLKIVQSKTVAAYEFAARAGAQVATSDPSILKRCATCGSHLGWMAQILNDIEDLWFPACDSGPINWRTFPVLTGFSIAHPVAHRLADLLHDGNPDRPELCRVLDDMRVRMRLMTVAIGHRDQAIASLGAGLEPEGVTILRLWLDWFLRDGTRLVTDV